MSNHDDNKRFTFRGFRGNDIKGFQMKKLEEDTQEKEEFIGFKTGGSTDPEEARPQDFPREEEKAQKTQVPVRKRKKRRKKHYLLKLAILTGLCIGIYLLLHSSLFNVETIKVKGNAYFKADTVQKMAGIKKGDNLFDLSLGDIEEKLMEHPYIKQAEVKRVLPQGVAVTLRERKAQAVIAYHKEYVYLDKYGVVLKTRAYKPKMTEILDLTVQKAEPGSKAQVKEKSEFHKAMKLVQEMDRGGLYFKKIRVNGIFTRAYLTDTMACYGKVKNVVSAIENGNLQQVIYDLGEKGKTKGIIHIGDDQYCSYQPKLTRKK